VSGHLLLVALGPVQDLIAQARRSRDLWFGSHLLSELSRAAANSLAECGGRLIFPALDRGDPELDRCDEPTRPSGKAAVSVANKILTECPEGTDPRALAIEARGAAHSRWRGIAERVRTGRVGAVVAKNVDDVWNEQVEEVLEFYAAWAPVDGDYAKARHNVEEALAARKNLREFAPWHHDRTGAPKSSLDGGRVSVLADDRSAAEFKRLRISSGEQLDAIGLVKRAGFKPEQFVPLVNITAADWLAKAEVDASGELEALRAASRRREIHRVERDLPAVRPFRFDATVLYPSRWPALFKELEPPENDAARAREWGETHVRPLLKRMNSQPPAYVACLAADGDNMGKAIDRLEGPEANRAFSRALAGFPEDARRIVEGEHKGSLIYAGGDDVLAFLPVAIAPECAAALAQAFREGLEKDFSGDVPTLSAGIGIGHVIEPMSVLLALAREAEREAKKQKDKDALAIIVDKRSGGERRLALKWRCEPIERMREDARLLDGALSTGKLHALEALLRRFPDPKPASAQPEAAAALAAYAKDVLTHSAEGKGTTLGALGVEPTDDYASFHDDLRKAIDRILVVRTLRELGFQA
jgi:CRISPR-associated protein Cmr2